MKTFNLKTSQSAVQNPASRPEGAHGATGEGLAGGARKAVSAPDPEVPAQKVRRKLTAQYKLRTDCLFRHNGHLISDCYKSRPYCLT